MANTNQYDELEHEGDENFSFQTREDEKDIKTRIKTAVNAKLEENKEKLQEKWLSVDNPFIWEGDFID